MENGLNSSSELDTVSDIYSLPSEESGSIIIPDENDRGSFI